MRTRVNFVLLLLAWAQVSTTVTGQTENTAKIDGSTSLLQLMADNLSKDNKILILKIQHLAQLNKEMSQELRIETSKLDIATQEIEASNAAHEDKLNFVKSSLCDNLKELQGPDEIATICSSEQKQETELLVVTLTNTIQKIKHEMAQLIPKTMTGASSRPLIYLIHDRLRINEQEALQTTKLISELKSLAATCLSKSQTSTDKYKRDSEQTKQELNKVNMEKQACELAKINVEVKAAMLEIQKNDANKNHEKCQQEIQILQHDNKYTEKILFASNNLLEHVKNENKICKDDYEKLKTGNDSEIIKILQECESNVSSSNLEIEKNCTFLNEQLLNDTLLVQFDLETCKNQTQIDKQIAIKITQDFEDLKTKSNQEIENVNQWYKKSNETSEILMKENADLKLSLNLSIISVTELNNTVVMEILLPGKINQCSKVLPHICTFGTKKYYFSHESDLLKNFGAAESFCRAKDMHLINIESEQENKFVTEILYENLKLNKLVTTKFAWLGASGPPGNLTSTKTGRELSYTNWSIDLLEYTTHELYRVCIDWTERETSNWDLCSNGLAPFVCEF